MAAISADGAGRPLIDFDQHSLDYGNRWRQICDFNLAHCPVARTSANGGYWVALRRLIGQSLSPERSGRWEPYIRRAVAACLGRARDSGEIDLVLDLASPLAAGVVMQVVGLPLDGCAELARAIHTVEFAEAGTLDFERAATALADWGPVISSLIETRRREQAGDLISRLANSVIDGEPIPAERIIGICYLVLGSADITTGFIANALHWLHEFPDRRRTLIEDPRLVAGAVEELLRYHTPIHGLARTATRDAELSGQHVRAGDRLWLHFAAANRDPAVFEDPDEVRLDRSPNRHASFGFGIHHCVGAPLARLQARVTLEMVLAHAPDYIIDLLGASRYADIGKFNGFKKMPASFPPRCSDGY